MNITKITANQTSFGLEYGNIVRGMMHTARFHANALPEAKQARAIARLDALEKMHPDYVLSTYLGTKGYDKADTDFFTLSKKGWLKSTGDTVTSIPHKAKPLVMATQLYRKLRKFIPTR